MAYLDTVIVACTSTSRGYFGGSATEAVANVHELI